MNTKSEVRGPKPDLGNPKPEESFEPFVTKLTVAERMEVEIRTVTRLMRRGVLRYYKVGPMVRFKWSEVESDLREHFHVCFDPRRPSPLSREIRNQKVEIRKGENTCREKAQKSQRTEGNKPRNTPNTRNG